MTPPIMPVLFVGHGSPMNAIENNQYSHTWEVLGNTVPTPKAILCISAHWELPITAITTMPHPRTIHDFGGFPPELYQKQYHAPGHPEMATHIQNLISSNKIQSDTKWGLDHGTWAVLCRMYPQANIPVLQLSLNYKLDPKEHYILGTQLRELRNEGVLIVGSGNIVHNLGIMRFNGQPYPWAIEFDRYIEQQLKAREFDSIINFDRIPHREIAFLTTEHYLPLLYVIGAADPNDHMSFPITGIELSSVSMRCVFFSAEKF